MKLRLGVDICNTLADVNAEIGRVRGIKSWRPERYALEPLEIRDGGAFFAAHPEIFVRAEPLPVARETLWTLARRWEIFYITSRPLWAKELTIAWLAGHGFPPGELVMGIPKAAAVQQLGLSAFAEDDPMQVGLLQRVCPVYPIAWPYNGSKIGWHEIAKILGKR
jgi:hypothetical protein